MKKAIKNQSNKTILALDIGGGTQDLLIWNPGDPVENAIQCVLPSPTIMVAQRIRQATAKNQAIFLSGHVMGGGASSQAIRAHLKAGLPVFATEEAALTLNDNLERIKALGIRIDSQKPVGTVEIALADIQEKALQEFFQAFSLRSPDHYLVAVQDHGFSPSESNRRFRFRQWEDFLRSKQPLETLLYRDPPVHLTRMKAVQEIWPQARVMDTGAAAVLGALEDEKVSVLGGRTRLIVNVGNEHTLAAWMVEGIFQGLFEHHTGLLTQEKLLQQLNAFITGDLTNDQILLDGGHGCLNHSPQKVPTSPLVVTGPRRGLLSQTPVLMAAPFGNMMLSGCFGLVRAFRFSNPD
jgi:uncharacterized protein (DUF1786 family)